MSKNIDNMQREELLNTPICELDISLNNSWVNDCIKQLKKELLNKDITFSPKFWIGDDWYCPDGIVGISIPFFIFHPKLIALEKEFMGEVEGANKKECMKLLRHEIGHALDNAYRLRFNRQRQKLFGKSSLNYPHTYLPLNYSKKYVRHLKYCYAQSHPDEDWAETFAVWLTPKSSWKNVYKNWPALKKLELVDTIVNSIKNKRPINNKKEIIEPTSENTMTLKKFYQIRCKQNKNSIIPMNELFSIKKNGIKASKLIAKEKKEICKYVSNKSGYYQYHIEKILKDIQNRCHKKNLYFKYNDYNFMLSNAILKRINNYIDRGNHRIIM